jgi:hypothetical protein
MHRLGLTLLLAVVIAAPCDAQCTGEFLPGRISPTTRWNKAVAANIVDSTLWDSDGPGPNPPRLVAVGVMDTFGGVDGGVVWVYDGSSWTPLGKPPVLPRSVAVWNGSLVIGGFNYVARWDGAAWVQSPPIAGNVAALLEHNGVLYAGTDQRPTILRWNGEVWEQVGPGDFFGTTRTMASYNGDLIVGGEGFRPFGTLPTVSCMRFDGANWSNMPGGHTVIRELVVRDGELLGGGDGGLPHSVRRWDGAAWQQFGQVLPVPVSSFVVHDGQFLAGGSTLGTGNHRVYRLESDQWSTVYAPTAPHQLGTQLTHLMSYGGSLFSGGTCQTPSGAFASDVGILGWNGAVFEPLYDGFSSAITGLVPYDGGGLVAFGSFSTIDRKAVRNIARYSGGQWSPLGTGIGSQVIIGAAQAGGDLYVTGDFTGAGGVGISHNLAAWDGSGWRNISGGPAFGSGSSRNIYGVMEYQGQLLVYGRFASLASRADTAYCALYNGTTWNRFAVNPAQAVRGAAVLGGQLYIIENNQLARWTGNDWERLGRGDCCGAITHLAVHGDDLIVAGTGSSPTGPPRYLARWDGSAWHSFGDAFTCCTQVTALGSYNGELYVGGNFQTVAGLENVAGVVRWDGQTWRSLGTGLTGQGSIDGLNAQGHPTQFINHNGELWIGGHFKNAGPRHSPYLARWITTPCCATSDFDGDGDSGTDADIEAFFACLAGTCCSTCWHLGSDFNADGDSGTDGDIEAFFRVLAGGAC